MEKILETNYSKLNIFPVLPLISHFFKGPQGVIPTYRRNPGYNRREGEGRA
jgi:hypothetical protein